MELTPKEKYEGRKAERESKRKLEEELGRHHDKKEAMMEDLIDRFVTAAERIADALERRPA